jgi:hypothetical protein
MTTVVVAGALANKPANGGEAWVRLSWLLGLRRLGYDVCFVEQLSPEACVDTNGVPTPVARSNNLAFFRAVVDRFGLSSTSSLIYDDGAQVFGMAADELLAWAESAVALFNISGHLNYEPLMRRFTRKIYVDLDPGFTQYWHASGKPLGIENHDEHLTVGGNVGTDACPIPTRGIRWHPVRPPVVLDEWTPDSDGVAGRFTTVGGWRGAFGPITWDGRTFGLKVHEFRKFAELPRRAPGTFEIGLDIHPADAKDKAMLEGHGWRLVDPGHVAADPDAFRAFVQASGAEFSVAQGIYVETNSGWFSDRTVSYLAAGRPALVQDTGFSRTLPTGEGLLCFTTMEEAIAGARELLGAYERHSRAARALAKTFFDSDVVLGALVGEPDASR